MTNFHSHADDWSAKDLLINALDKGSANGNQMLNYIDQVLNADDVYMGIDSNDDTTFVFSGVRQLNHLTKWHTQPPLGGFFMYYIRVEEVPYLDLVNKLAQELNPQNINNYGGLCPLQQHQQQQSFQKKD